LPASAIGMASSFSGTSCNMRAAVISQNVSLRLKNVPVRACHLVPTQLAHNSPRGIPLKQAFLHSKSAATLATGTNPISASQIRLQTSLINQELRPIRLHLLARLSFRAEITTCARAESRDGGKQKRRCYQRRSGAPTRGTGPLRLALAGATRSGSAGVGSPGSRSGGEATPRPSGVNWNDN
jgi:hypothetical protein